MEAEKSWNPMVPELSVTDFAKSFDFYTNVLGFKVVHSRKNPSFAYLDLEGAQLMIEQYQQSGWNTGALNYPLGRGVNFQIELSNISGIHNNLKQLGYSLFRELEENWYQGENEEFGQKEFLVQDPDGYLLRFCQTLASR